ncbi:hypothetical protein CCYA_CCYA15G3990 [Cyanidiococcus yangmingshanensis]|nr:hypothetical protein CCYA_CCYA15G3990 [Cyanidiococcus yangmingshanensis]
MDGSRQDVESATPRCDKEGTDDGDRFDRVDGTEPVAVQTLSVEASDQARVLFRAADADSTTGVRQGQMPSEPAAFAPGREPVSRGDSGEKRAAPATGPAHVWVLYQGRACRFRVTRSLTAGQLLDEAERVLVGATPLDEDGSTGAAGWCLADAQGALVPRACALISSESSAGKQTGRFASQAPLDAIFSEEALRNAELLAGGGSGVVSKPAQNARLSAPDTSAPWLWPVFHLVRCPAASQRRRVSSMRTAQLAARLAPGAGPQAPLPAAMTRPIGTIATAATLAPRQRQRNVATRGVADDHTSRCMDDSSTETEEDTESESGRQAQHRDHDIHHQTVRTPSDMLGTSRHPANLAVEGTPTVPNWANHRVQAGGHQPLQPCAICGQVSPLTRSCAILTCGRAYHPSCLGVVDGADASFICDQHVCAGCGTRFSGQAYLCKLCSRLFCAHHVPSGSRREAIDVWMAAADGDGHRVGLITCALCMHQQSSGSRPRLMLVPPAPDTQSAPLLNSSLQGVPLMWTTSPRSQAKRSSKPSKRTASSITKQPPMPPAAPLRPEEEEAGPLLTMTMLDDGKRYILGARTRGLTGYDEAAGLCNNRFLQAAFLVLREAEWMRRKRLIELSERATKTASTTDQDRGKYAKAVATIPPRVEMDAREILRVARARGFNPTVSPEPHNTFSSQIYRNMKRRREASTFRKADRGKFTLAPWVLEELNQRRATASPIRPDDATGTISGSVGDLPAEGSATAVDACEASSSTTPGSAPDVQQNEASRSPREASALAATRQPSIPLDSTT